MPPDPGASQRRWRPGWPVDLATTLGPLRRGDRDPCLRIGRGEVWRATLTPDGPATVHYARSGDAILATAWGPGREAELELVPQVLGADDDPRGFAHGAHPVMAAAWRRFAAGLRITRTGRALEALAPAILEQRVTGVESRRAWRWLVVRHGEPAPGPTPGPESLRVPPEAPRWAQVPSWDFHRAGVDPGRARALVAAAGRAAAIEALSGRSPEQACAALATLPGIGAWTAAEVAVRAWGHIDAVSFGDAHVARTVTHALTGRLDGDDSTAAELLRPWSGQRARAVRLLELHVGPQPRRGPRATITDHRAR